MQFQSAISLTVFVFSFLPLAHTVDYAHDSGQYGHCPGGVLKCGVGVGKGD
jgi:hypothetical protein